MTPKSAAQSSTSGSRLGGISSSSSSSVSHCWLWILNSRVREALVASVLCDLPPVRRHSRKLSTVPKRSSPRSARARAPATLSRIQRNLVPEK
ncbi:hypothetical protein D3C86_1533130 [compost metagenome]